VSKILILTHAQDDSAQMVINCIEKLVVPYIRFNTEEFHHKVKLSLHMTSSGILDGSFKFPEQQLPFREIGIVWNRRIHEPALDEELAYEPAFQEWAFEESKYALLNAITLIDAPIVNPIEFNEHLKFNKWIQMKRATELGLDIPSSLMSNQQGSIVDFWEETNHSMIFKKIRKGILCQQSGKRTILHTSLIPPEKMKQESLERMRFCPMFFQKHVEKKYDVRSIVVGDQVFSVAIHSQDIPESMTDFRTAGILGKMDELKHEIINLGDSVNRKLVEYTKSFGLTFGAIDLIVTPDDNLVFLEDNPNGQWGWLELRTGIKIAEAIANHLVKSMI